MWSAADLHVHTTASDGLASPEEVVDWVDEYTDLTVVAITDHNSVDGSLAAFEYARAKQARVEVVVGQEVDSRDGHIIGLWAPAAIAPGMSAQQTVRAIHEQGGIAIAAHPFAPRWWHRHGLSRGDIDEYDTTSFDAVEVANSTPLLLFANVRARLYWRANRHRLAKTGGSDAHILSVIGSSKTLFEGSTALDLRAAIVARTTRVVGPGVSPRRGLRYARDVREIKQRNRALRHRS